MVLHLAWLFVVGEAQRMGKPLVNVDPSLVTEATPAGAFWDELPCARTARIFFATPIARRPPPHPRHPLRRKNNSPPLVCVRAVRSLDAAVLG